MKTNPEIRRAAKASLKGHWWAAIVPVLLYLLVAGGFTAPGLICPGNYWIFGGTTILEVLLFFPLAIGFYYAYYKFAAVGDDNILSNIFKTGFGNYFHNLAGYLLYGLIVAICLIFLIVPGIIMGLAYSMLPFILVDEPELSICEALKKSRMMMKGHKMDLFLLCLGYMGLYILSALTLFIALFWLVPYFYTILGHFYDSLKADYVPQGTAVEA